MRAEHRKEPVVSTTLQDQDGRAENGSWDSQ